MARTVNPNDLIDHNVIDHSGSKIGKVGTVYLAEDTKRPEWITVKTGLFGTKETFVPLAGAAMHEDGLHVTIAKDQVSDAPRIDADGQMSAAEAERLYQYYGMPMPRSAGHDDLGHGGQRGRQGQEDRGQAMTRSEERLRVGTQSEEAGRFRLRKYVVTEEQQVTVPVSHEEVRIQREPITDPDSIADASIGEEQQEVVLRAEKPVVTTEAVPVERVRLGKETVTEQRTVSGKVRKEKFDVDDRDERKR
ncbi:DUF2382 domain-containing protein [Pseudonocardiaceae bacterium YIM PH 21723]|nr:DUF2382 domain-containing protein [Pseudonocardiaceae bacterium YIM PH 21723]